MIRLRLASTRVCVRVPPGIAFAGAFVVAFAVATWGSAAGLGGGAAFAQQARPVVRGRSHRVKVDSSPQQAAVYWDIGTNCAGRSPGIAGLHAHRSLVVLGAGAVTILVELQGFKPQQQALDVRRSQTVNFTLERAPQPAKLDLQTTDGSAAGADVKIDGASVGTIPNAFDVAAGRHQVEVNKAGMKTWTEWFTLAEGEHHTHDVSLVVAQAPSALRCSSRATR